jgi:parallel beta-helix repeat protein
VFFSHDLRIVGNEFRRNGQIGIHIEKSTGNLIRGNLFADNGDFGVFVQADGNQVRRNHCVRNGTGILVGPGSRNAIAGNRVAGGGEGIAIEKGRGNVVVRNVVTRTRHSGIRLGIGDPPIGSTDTLVRGNLVTAAGKDGFLVAKNDRNALLQGNTARRSGDDGFDINSRSARLIGNRAVGSADFEVERP